MPTVAKDLPVIQGVRVDIEALRALAHVCDPMSCRHAKCCCKSYEILVDPQEERTVVGMMREAARYSPALIEDGEFADPIEDVFGDACLATHEDGTCVFAFHTPQGAVRCSLHTAALDLGLPPAETKPKACTLWPLYLDENPPPLLTIQDDALEFPCNSRISGAPLKLHSGIREIIEAIFGAAFLAEVENALFTPHPEQERRGSLPS